MNEQDLRATLDRVIKGVIIVIALSLVKGVASFLLSGTAPYGSLSVNAWVRIVLSLVIVGFVVKLYAPVQALTTFYLSALVKASIKPDRELKLEHLLIIAERLVLILFLLAGYQCLLPAIMLLNAAFFGFTELLVVLNVAVVLAVAGVLVWMWKDARPLYDLLTGRITEQVLFFSNGLMYRTCAGCGAKNERNAAVCASCGAGLEPRPEPVEPVSMNRICPTCDAVVPPEAKFCCMCGKALPDN